MTTPAQRHDDPRYKAPEDREAAPIARALPAEVVLQGARLRRTGEP